MEHDATQPGCGARQGEEKAFEHLEELLELIPGMQEKGDLLARARHADAVAKAASGLDACRSMLDRAEEELKAAEEALAEARARDDEAAVDACRRAALFAASMRGFRVGPAQNAARMLDEALAASPFSCVQDALDTRLDECERRCLEAEIDAYQDDYAETLALCERLEGVSVDEQ